MPMATSLVRMSLVGYVGKQRRQLLFLQALIGGNGLLNTLGVATQSLSDATCT